MIKILGQSRVQSRTELASVQPYFSLKTTHPDSMVQEWEAFFGQGFPLAERLYYGLGGFKTQFTLVEELGGQREQGLMRTIVVD